VTPDDLLRVAEELQVDVALLDEAVSDWLEGRVKFTVTSYMVERVLKDGKVVPRIVLALEPRT
jgi:hypothetical protein